MILNDEPMNIEDLKGMFGCDEKSEMTTSLITEPTQENFAECIKSNPSYIQFFQDKLTPETMLEAVKRDGMVLEHLRKCKDIPYEVVLEAVKQNHLAIKFAPPSKISEEVVLEVVRKDGLLLKLINDPTDTIILTAIRQNPVAIQFVNKVVTEEMCIEAVKSDPFFIRHIANPTANVLYEAVKKDWRAAEFAVFNPDKVSPQQGGPAAVSV